MNNYAKKPVRTSQHSERPSDRTCPRCRFSLATITVADAIDIERCYHCRGSFLDPGEETALLGPLASPAIWQASELVTHLGVSDLESPATGRLMTRFRLVYEKSVEIERCEDTGGLWLDAGEGDTLRELLEKAAQAKTSPLEAKRPELHAGTYVFQLFSGVPIEVWNPRTLFPWTTFWIIAACMGVFALELLASAPSGDNSLIDSLALSPQLFEGENVWGVLTYMFLHGSTAHLFGNMLYLYIFGDNVEDKLGRKTFLRLYLTCGVAGGLAQALFVGPEGLAVVGASGAIAGVIAAYWVLFPFVRLRMVIFAIPIYLGIGTYTVGWLAINLWMSTLSTGQTHTAWFCHLGGFAAGILMAWPHRTKRYADIVGEKFKKR